MTLPDSVVRLLDAGYLAIPACAPAEHTGCTASWHHPCSDPGKIPLIKGYPDFAIHRPSREVLESELTSRSYPVNFGIVVGSDIVAIDSDSSIADAEVLSLISGSLITPMRSPRNGRGHVWIFRVPEGVRVGKATHRGTSQTIDVLAPGSFLIVPPSIHASGHRYNWVSGRSPWDVLPADLPESLREIAVSRTDAAPMRSDFEGVASDAAVTDVKRLIFARGHLRRLFEGERAGAGDASASGVDFALARALLALNVKTNVIVRIILERPGVHRSTLEYAARTVTAAAARKGGDR